MRWQQLSLALLTFCLIAAATDGDGADGGAQQAWEERVGWAHTELHAREGGLARLRVRKLTTTRHPLRLSYAPVFGGLAVPADFDVQAASGTLQLDGQQSSAELSFRIYDDGLLEGPETLHMQLKSEDDGVIVQPSIVVVHIADAQQRQQEL